MEQHVLRRRLGHDPPSDVMRLAERHLMRAHQPVGEVGRGGIACPCGFTHARDVGRHVANHAGHGGNRQSQGGKGVHRAFLVLLHVLLVGERQCLKHDQQCLERTDDAIVHQRSGVGGGSDSVGRVRLKPDTTYCDCSWIFPFELVP